MERPGYVNFKICWKLSCEGCCTTQDLGPGKHSKLDFIINKTGDSSVNTCQSLLSILSQLA